MERERERKRLTQRERERERDAEKAREEFIDEIVPESSELLPSRRI